jgi:preprotein translocase subunit YajC
MKRIVPFIIMTFFLFSCQSRIVSQKKPLQANSLELYQNYTIITNAPAQYKVQILRQDEQKIYTKNKNGEEITINKSDIREVKKLDLLSSIAIALAAIAAVVFVPI